jgi:hypothetical protein
MENIQEINNLDTENNQKEQIIQKKNKGRPRKIEGRLTKEKEFVKEYNKSYYEKNKATLLNMYKEKKQCPKCGMFIACYNLSNHQKSKKCMETFKNTNSLNEPINLVT